MRKDRNILNDFCYYSSIVLIRIVAALIYIILVAISLFALPVSLIISIADSLHKNTKIKNDYFDL